MAQSNQIVGLPAATTLITIYVADSGKTLILPGQALACLITLPPLEPGLRYRFILSSNNAAAITITPPIPATITGILLNANAAANVTFAKAAAATVVITAVAVIGTTLDLNCDGQTWWATGTGFVANSWA